MIEVSIDSSRGSSMALDLNGKLFYRSDLDFGRGSDSEFLPCLQGFLAENGLELRDVEGWTVGLGPGSFAGIRFALALVKGICTVTGAKVRGVPSSAALARCLGRSGRVSVIQDARCGKVFVSVYDCANGICRPHGEPGMLDLSQSWPEWALAEHYCTPDSSLRQSLRGLDTWKLVDMAPPQAEYLLGADIGAWPWHETPDIEPIYVRPPA